MDIGRIIDRITMKQWFSRGRKPTEVQFAKTFDSFVHKTEDSIEISSINSLQQALDEKAEVEHRHAATDISGLPETDNELNLDSHNPIANSAVALALATKASITHSHGMADINGLQEILAMVQSHIWNINGKHLDQVRPDNNVALSHTQAVVGTNITAIVTEGTGYSFGGVTVTVLDNRGNATQHTVGVAGPDPEDGAYSFVMPFGDVAVSAVFNKKRYDIHTEISVRGGSISAENSALYGDEVEFRLIPAQGYETSSVFVVNDTTNEVIPVDGNDDDYTFIMPASSVTIRASFVETQPADPNWRLVNTNLDDWSGEYMLASVDDGMMATGNLQNYQIACGAVRLQDNSVITAADAVNAKKFTIGNKYFVQSGAYSGRYCYTITYVNGNGETKYLTYSASGLSNGSTINNNTRWCIEADRSGLLNMINIGSTTTRLYFYVDHVQQLTASNHDSISQDYHKLSLFKEEEEAQAAE